MSLALTLCGSVAELPHKLAHYVALIAFLSSTLDTAPSLMVRMAFGESDEGRLAAPAEDAAMVEEAKVEEEPKEVEETVGMAILGDLVKAFQIYLDDREWRSVRYCVSCKRFWVLRRTY